MSVFGWLSRHGHALRLGSILGAFVVLAGGLVLGMSSAASSSAPAPAAGGPPAKVAAPSRHYVVGTIVEAFKDGELIVRGTGGHFFAIDLDQSTSVRRNRIDVPAANLRRGTRVTILGAPRGGRLRAEVITITGAVPPRTPFPTAAAGATQRPARSTPRPTAAPNARPLPTATP